MFNHRKAVQALNFFAIKAREESVPLYKTNALKLIFFADKKHLRDALRTVTGDTYTAKQMGPVAKNVCDLIEAQTDRMEQESEGVKYANEFINAKKPFFNDKKIKITSKREVDEKVLSQSDISALNFVWNAFKNIVKSRETDLWKETHKYPEGERFRENNNQWTEIQEEDMFSTIENDPLGETDPKLSKELYQENQKAKTAFGAVN